MHASQHMQSCAVCCTKKCNVPNAIMKFYTSTRKYCIIYNIIQQKYVFHKKKKCSMLMLAGVQTDLNLCYKGVLYLRRTRMYIHAELNMVNYMQMAKKNNKTWIIF